jgi:transcriptional regulator with XRE-family HTH domain
LAPQRTTERASRRRAAAVVPSVPERAADHIQIGTRLRHARLTRGLSLRELAANVGCTESFLSKVENDKARPSLAMLHRLVSALEINIAALFSDNVGRDGPVTVMRRGERPTIKTDPLRRGDGVLLERLVSHAVAKLLQVNIHHVAPDGSSDGAITHDGEEMGFVLAGELELTVDDVTYVVREGDCFFFESHLPHGYRNRGTAPASVLWVNTPPNF